MTQNINLSLRYLYPKRSIGVFIVAVFIGELINLINMYINGRLITIKSLLHQLSGFLNMMIMPEVISFLGIIYTLKWIHELLKIKKIKLTANAIAVYELQLIVIILISFYIYFPFTYIVRYLLTDRIDVLKATIFDFPFYDFHFFSLYAFPILFVGLLLANISLFYDIMELNKATIKEELILSQTNESIIENIETEAKENLIPIKVLRVKDEKGYRDLKTSDIIYVQYSEIDKSRRVTFNHIAGVAQMRMSLGELENEIISLGNFYRVSRSIIVNMNYIEEYLIDTNSKKMTLKLIGASLEPDVSRYRIAGFKTAYAEFISSKKVSV